jgi:hypothetical protein
LVASPSTPGAYLFPEKNELGIGGMDNFGENLKLKNNSLNEQQKKVESAINKFLL